MSEVFSDSGHAPGWLPLSHLNLQVNPFGECTVEDRIATATVDCDQWTDWLSTDQHALQFIGDSGRGKSTHLLALSKHFATSHYLYIPPGSRCTRIPPGRPLLVDEAQRLLPWKRWRLLRRRIPLVLGTHRDLSGPLSRAGYAVRTVDLNNANDPMRLAKILNRRIEFARLRPGAIPNITVTDATVLFDRFGSNIRGAEHYLYQQVQQQRGGNHGEVRLVD